MEEIIPVKDNNTGDLKYKSWEEIEQNLFGKDSSQEATIYFVIPAQKLARERMYWAMGKLREIYSNKIKIIEKVAKYDNIRKKLKKKNTTAEAEWNDKYAGKKDDEVPAKPDSFLSQDEQLDLDDAIQNLEMYKYEYDRINEYKPELYSVINQTLDSLRMEFVSTAFGSTHSMDVEDNKFRKYDENSFSSARTIRNDTD